MKDLMNAIKVLSSRKLLAAFSLAGLLAGCSSVPDSVNPVEWYKNARDIMVKDDSTNQTTKQETVNRKPVRAESGSFPKLSSVPKRLNSSSKEEIKRIADGFAADQDKNRKYSSEIVRRQENWAPPLAKARSLLMPAPRTKDSPKAIEQSKAPMPAKLMKVVPALVAPQPVLALKPIVSDTLSPKPRVAPPPPIVNVPAVNPSAAEIMAVPAPSYASRQNGTVINSGGPVDSNGSRPGRANVSSVYKRSQFDPSNVQSSYQVATILFANGSSRIGARERLILRKVINHYRKVGGALRIVGHASRRTKTNDPIRHKMFNLDVSSARAERVAKELVEMGVNSNKLLVGSVSDSDPRYYEYMPTGEAGNRRAEIYIDF